MTDQEIETKLLEIAGDYSEKGPGYAQESVVLRAAADRLRPANLEDEQRILNCWQQLFRTGKLAWGYNLDNPGPPWYHVPAREPVMATSDSE